MRYCHECGEEIAEIDMFCPFCGITQIPVQREEETSQDKTIAVNQSELADLFENENEAADAAFSSEKSDISPELEKPAAEDEFPEKLEGNKETEQPQNITSENVPANTDSIDIPAQITPDKDYSQNKIPTEENLKTLEEPNFEEEFKPVDKTVSDKEELSLIEETDVPKPAIIDSDKPIAETPFKSSQSDSSSSASVAPRLYNAEKKSEKVVSENSQSDEVLEIQTETPGASDVVTETEEKPDSSDDSEIDFSQTIPYTPENLMGYSGELKKDDEVVQNISSDLEQKSDDAIDIPDEPIDLKDDSNTQFDSVRIMHDNESDANTLIKSVGKSAFVIPEKHENSKSAAAESKAAEEKDGRSFTTPNIGGSDTEGGKRGAKLKSLEEGTILNSRYEIVRKIGGGGMGAVYLATDKNLGGILRAVKEMVQSYIEETAQDKAVSDFKRESMLLTSLDHPSIPTIYDYFYDEKENRFYLVMKYISGGDLASRLRSATEGRIEEENVTEWAIQVADVLDYLHNRQPPIVYRDLKPSNIMIDGNSGRVMLIDFGIARWINKEEKGVTAVGTMGYAPPELFSGNVEPRSDIYSLGSTMFHLLTGADPQSNPLLIFDFQKHPRPRQINPQLSDQMEKILMRAVEYSADNRFRTAAELRNVLTEHSQNLKSGKVSYGVTKTPHAVSLADQNVFCGFCGQKIVATDMFCAFCGSKQPLAQQGVHSAEYVSPLTTAKLMIIGTNELDSPSYNLEKDENLLGRRDPLSNIFPEIDLSKFDPQTKVSRRHARIWREAGQFLIEDLGSSNGTVVVRVIGDSFRLTPHQPHPLTNGEKVKVGDTTLRFIVG